MVYSVDIKELEFNDWYIWSPKTKMPRGERIKKKIFINLNMNICNIFYAGLKLEIVSCIHCAYIVLLWKDLPCLRRGYCRLYAIQHKKPLFKNELLFFRNLFNKVIKNWTYNYQPSKCSDLISSASFLRNPGRDNLWKGRKTKPSKIIGTICRKCVKTA